MTHKIVTEAMGKAGCDAAKLPVAPSNRALVTRIYTAMSTAQEPAAMTCGDCGWQGSEAVWRAGCKGFPCELKARSTAQEPALDDDAELRERAIEAALILRVKGYSEHAEALDRIANRLQAKAPETGEGS